MRLNVYAEIVFLARNTRMHRNLFFGLSGHFCSPFLFMDNLNKQRINFANVLLIKIHENAQVE